MTELLNIIKYGAILVLGFIAFLGFYLFFDESRTLITNLKSVKLKGSVVRNKTTKVKKGKNSKTYYTPIYVAKYKGKQKEFESDLLYKNPVKKDKKVKIYYREDLKDFTMKPASIVWMLIGFCLFAGCVCGIGIIIYLLF